MEREINGEDFDSYFIELNMFLVLTFYAPLINSPYTSLNVFKILTFYLRYQN